jgi:hypothetical protein
MARAKKFFSRLFNKRLSMTEFNKKLRKLNKAKLKGFTDE